MNCEVKVGEEEKGSYSERIDFAVQEISLLQVGPQFDRGDGKYYKKNNVGHEHDKMAGSSQDFIICFIWSKKNDVSCKEWNESYDKPNIKDLSWFNLFRQFMISYGYTFFI